ncbi:MAG: MgtC/SapB family protein [Rhizobiaceae bacterium]|nr:MgtC/SapB family protein [Rhizobiaceae bacterium]
MEEQAARLALSLAIGLLVGLERGWRERDAPDHSRTAGLRTYGISGLLGGLSATLSAAVGSPGLMVAALLVFAALLGVYKMREAIADEDFSATGVIAGVAVFLLGALAVAGDYRLAAGGGAALAAVMASRETLHRLLRRMTWQELRAALTLAAMTAIVLPLLPDRAVDPWGGFNPREVWLFTILVAAISFAGYVATRVFGQGRGLLVSSILGAIVSSTAVTVSLARRTTEPPSLMAGAAALAAAVSVTRVLLIVAAVSPAVLWHVLLPAGAAALVFACGGVILLFGTGRPDTDQMGLKNPFDLGPLLFFAAAFAAIASASAYLRTLIGEPGMLATSAIAGMFDVDVAVLSAVRQVGTPGASTLAASAANAVLLALISNGMARAVLAGMTGTIGFSLRYAGISIGAATAAALVYIV